MHHGDNVQQVILAQLLQAIGELLHINVLITAVLLLGCILTTDAVRIGSTRFL